MRAIAASLILLIARNPISAQEPLSFPTEDGGLVHAVACGGGDRAVVLAHGGQFNKESWHAQCQALAKAGFRVLAFDFRGHGQSRGPAGVAQSSDQGRHYDVLAAVRYLRTNGAKVVTVIGASMGGDYAAAAAEAEPSAIDRLVLIAAGAYTPLRRMTGPKLFIMSRDDVIGDNRPRLPQIRARYEEASGPKEFVTLDGSAHAQAIFTTPQGDRLLREILRFLSSP